MEVYQSHTGDTESRPLVIGGGTYAKAAKNTAAFGALFPGDADLMHQKDERLSLDRFMTMTRIYADALYKLTQPDFTLMEESPVSYTHLDVYKRQVSEAAIRNRLTKIYATLKKKIEKS